MNKNIDLKKINFVADHIAIITYCYMVLYTALNSFAYNVIWPEWWGDSWDIAVGICTFIAVYKVFIYFDTYRMQACVSLAFLVIATIIQMISPVDYLYLISATVMFFRMDYCKVVKALVVSLGTFLTITLISVLLGVIPNYTQNVRDNVKYSLGYVEHNGFMLYFFMLVLGVALLIKQNKILFGVITCFCSAVLYLLTGSTTSTAVLFFFAFLVIVDELIRHDRGFVGKIYDLFIKLLMGLPIYIFVFLSLGALYFNIFQRTRLDNTYISRLYLIDKALEEANFPMPNSNYEPTDVVFNLLWGTAGADSIFSGETLYMSLFIKWGLIALLPCFALFIIGFVKAYNRNDRILLFVLYALAFMGISESPHFNVACCAFYCVYIAARDKKRRRKRRVYVRN